MSTRSTPPLALRSDRSTRSGGAARRIATALLAASGALWGAFGAGVPHALAASAPELISPTSSSYTSSPLRIAYKLPEACGAAVQLTFHGESEFKAVIELAGAEAREAGEHSVSFDTKELEATSNIVDSTGVKELPDGVYSIVLSCEGSAAEATGVHLVTSTAAPTLTAPAEGSEATGPFTVEYTLPEAAQTGSVTLSFEGEGSGASVLTLSNVLAGAHSIKIDPADPRAATSEVVSGPSRLPSDNYTLTLSYADYLGNPVASSSPVEFTLESRCVAGTYSPSYGEAPCIEAEPGHYVSELGATEELACIAGTYAPGSGSSFCAMSPEGSYAPAGSSTPVQCAAGTFDPHTESTSSAACEEDAPGSYSAAGAAVATPCAPGRFAPTGGSTACLPAEPGHFVQDAGATTELPCPAGSFASDPGSASCEPAPVNTYAREGAVEPTPCPAGTEAPDEGASECAPIPAAPSSGQGGGSGGGGTGAGSAASSGGFASAIGSSGGAPSSTAAGGASGSIPTTSPPAAPSRATATATIGKLTIHERAFGVAALTARSPHRPTVSFQLNVRAVIRYTLYRATTARHASCWRSDARCSKVLGARTGPLRPGTRRTALARLLRQAKAKHPKRSQRRSLAPGTYVLVLTAIAPDAGRSRPASVRFTVR